MRPRLTLVLGLGCALAAGCEAGERSSLPEPVPTSLRGAIVIEPPQLTVGDVATVEVTVITPPEHRVRPVEPPREVAGFWLLDARPLPTVRSASRWVHRTQIRARAREPGAFSWPALRVEVETPTQEIVEVPLEARPLQVASVADRFPQRTSPFPLRGADSSSRAAFLLPLAGGAALALAVLLLLAAVRRLHRRRGREADEQAPEVRATPRWRAAQATLEAARQQARESPERAADAASAALRHFFSQRFAVSARTLTTEELLALRTPLGAEKHWLILLEILAALDAVRFRSDPQATVLGETLERASRLVAEAAPEARWR